LLACFHMWNLDMKKMTWIQKENCMGGLIKKERRCWWGMNNWSTLYAGMK
jgi:hypothetical protein